MKDNSSGIINIWNLPQEKIFVKLNKNTRRVLVSKLLRRYKTLAEISRRTGLSYSITKKFKYGTRSISLQALNKIIITLGKPQLKDLINKNIEKLLSKTGGKGISQPKTLFNFNSIEGAIFLSAIFHDGGINKDMQPFYANFDEKMRTKIKNVSEQIFGKAEFYENKKDNPFVRFPKIIGIILVYGLGMKPGYKVYNNPAVPEFILSSDLSIKKAFIKQAFDDEGSISRNEIYFSLATDVTNIPKEVRSRIKKFKLLKFASRIFLADKAILENIGIKPTFSVYETKVKKNKEIRHYWQMCITTKLNLLLFANNVGFTINYKKEKLKKLAKKYEKKKEISPYGKGKVDALKRIGELEKSKGYFNSITLAKFLDKSFALSSLRIKQLKDEKLIKKIGEQKSRGPIPIYLYRISERGRRYIKSQKL